MRIAKEDSAKLRQSSSATRAKPVQGSRSNASISPLSSRLLVLRDDKLQLLIQSQVHRRFNRAQITRRNTTIKAPEPFMSNNLRQTVQAILIPPRHQLARAILPRPIQLQSRLDKPYRIRARGREHARGAGRKHVSQHGALVADPVFRNEPLDVSVGVEFDCAGGHDADEVRAQAAEHAVPAFGAVDKGEDAEGFAELEDGSRGSG